MPRYTAHMATPTRTYTPEDLLAMEDGGSYELVDGELKERHMSYLSTWIAARFIYFFSAYQDLHGGSTLSSDAGLTIFPWAPNLVRKPDAAFVRAGRGDPVETGIDTGYALLPPDVVVEVLSPNDTAFEVDRKVREYLRAGVRLVWVAYPESRAVHIYRQSGGAAVLDDTATLTGEDVLPGFEVPVARLFPPAK